MDLAGRRIIDRSVSVASSACGGVVVVVPAADVDAESGRLDGVHVVAGGDTRSQSVRKGLAAVPDSARIVLVHDAARPLADRMLYSAVIEAIDAGAVAVVPTVPPVDTLRVVGGGTIDRDSVRIVQTPQGFDADVLRRAHDHDGEGTDDASLVEALGHEVTLVDGRRFNLKITEPVDLEIARVLVDRPVDVTDNEPEGNR